LKVFAVTLDNLHKPLELAKNDGKKNTYVDQWVAAPEKDAKGSKKGVKNESADDADEDDLEDLDSTNAPVIDPIRAETLNIAADLITLRTASNGIPNMAKARE